MIATFPGYQSLYAIAEALGCSVTRWPLEVCEDRWGLDLDFLAAAIQPETRLLVVNFPHNPTGYLPSRDELEAIMELARRHDLHVFSDEMYRLLEYDAETRLPPVADLYKRGISLSGLSKSFALPGLRIGWLAMQDADLLARCIAFHDYTTICNSAPAEILGIMALRAAGADHCPQPGDHRAQPDRDGATLHPERRPLHLAAAAGRLSGLPAACAAHGPWVSSAGMCWRSEM